MKDDYIRIRCTEEDKELIQKAAEANHTTMSAYILKTLRDDYRRYIPKVAAYYQRQSIDGKKFVYLFTKGQELIGVIDGIESVEGLTEI